MSTEPIRLSVLPGRLLKQGESCDFIANAEGDLVISRRTPAPKAELQRFHLTAGQAQSWQPADCGNYVLEFHAGGERLQAPLAVVGPGWAVCQITVGAFTSEDFAETIHGSGVAADYYIGLSQRKGEAFTAFDERWPQYERLFGDAIHPHVMARDIGAIDESLAHEDPNWDSLTEEGIQTRLKALQNWWIERGYEPLDRLATYTPSNIFVKSCGEQGLRIMHSLVPEQNWSDGEWAINHWGMPTCPFWIASDDFRKAGRRGPNSVLGMTMNHYQVLIPHLTHWGDFVLSPSHFARWLRAADAGETPVRFGQFAEETVKSWTAFNGDPFFFVAGFEFGRTFGTKIMTRYNRRGLEKLISLSEKYPLAFATSRDVLAYYDRHIEGLPERAFRQRDSWAGVTVNGKPGVVPDSLVIEREDYKAVIVAPENQSFFYYDYLTTWTFHPRDEDAPHDYAEDCRKELSVEQTAGSLKLSAKAPLTRTIPVAVWDAGLIDSPFTITALPVLDDDRKLSLIEIPKGWSGSVEIPLTPVPAAAPASRWETKTFGLGAERHTYLHANLPLVKDTPLKVRLKKAARVDSAQGPLGELAAGEHALPYGLLLQWYRFWECGPEDIEVSDADLPAADSPLLVQPDWENEVARHEEEIHAKALVKGGWKPEDVLCGVLCGANLPLGTRSRASKWDRLITSQKGVKAAEFGDGVIAFGPTRSFWYHPRGFHFKVSGIDPSTQKGWKILLNSFDPQGRNAAYHVKINNRVVGHWVLPQSPEDDSAWYTVEATPEDLNHEGRLVLSLGADQTAVLDEWWAEKGFIAAVHAVWVGEKAA